MTNGQWRGVIEEYRDLLELPEGLAAVTLRELDMVRDVSSAMRVEGMS